MIKRTRLRGDGPAMANILQSLHMKHNLEGHIAHLMHLPSGKLPSRQSTSFSRGCSYKVKFWLLTNSWLGTGSAMWSVHSVTRSLRWQYIYAYIAVIPNKFGIWSASGQMAKWALLLMNTRTCTSGGLLSCRHSPSNSDDPRRRSSSSRRGTSVTNGIEEFFNNWRYDQSKCYRGFRKNWPWAAERVQAWAMYLNFALDDEHSSYICYL